MELVTGPSGIIVYRAIRHKVRDERLRQFMLIMNKFMNKTQQLKHM